ncbi:MAG: hypothetical protein M1827_007422 [Pycnora praestabilis]|nr:MAG: hypothetical protein M1827_007422 [Pycnora praestabilis]
MKERGIEVQILSEGRALAELSDSTSSAEPVATIASPTHPSSSSRRQQRRRVVDTPSSSPVTPPYAWGQTKHKRLAREILVKGKLFSACGRCQDARIPCVRTGATTKCARCTAGGLSLHDCGRTPQCTHPSPDTSQPVLGSQVLGQNKSYLDASLELDNVTVREPSWSSGGKINYREASRTKRLRQHSFEEEAELDTIVVVQEQQPISSVGKSNLRMTHSERPKRLLIEKEAESEPRAKIRIQDSEFSLTRRRAVQHSVEQPELVITGSRAVRNQETGGSSRSRSSEEKSKLSLLQAKRAIVDRKITIEKLELERAELDGEIVASSGLQIINPSPDRKARFKMKDNEQLYRL